MERLRRPPEFGSIRLHENDEYQRCVCMPDESSDVALKLGVAVIADRPAIFCIRGADALNLISQQATVVVVRPICRGSKSEEGRKAPHGVTTARTALRRAEARPFLNMQERRRSTTFSKHAPRHFSSKQYIGCACTVAKHEQLRQPQHCPLALLLQPVP